MDIKKKNSILQKKKKRLAATHTLPQNLFYRLKLA